MIRTILSINVFPVFQRNGTKRIFDSNLICIHHKQMYPVISFELLEIVIAIGLCDRMIEITDNRRAISLMWCMGRSTDIIRH